MNSASHHAAQLSAAQGPHASTTAPIEFIDSHTGGEPTRVIIRGGPDLGSGSMAQRLEIFRTQHDDFRRTVVNEPRGSDVMVGALLLEPTDADCVAGVVYFDNVTFIGMCGHGTIGLVTTLAHLGRITPGRHRIETPVGVVTAELHPDYSVSITNIPSHRHAAAITIDVPENGPVTGDVAYGGNWFLLVEHHGQQLALGNVETLTRYAWALRQAVNAQGYPEVDHIVLLSPVDGDAHHWRDFVLCPGKAYDRSPCGTGTSAWLACLAASDRLAPHHTLVLESIVGSHFHGTFQWIDDTRKSIRPTITGNAYVMASGSLLRDPRDPFQRGIAPQ